MADTAPGASIRKSASHKSASSPFRRLWWRLRKSPLTLAGLAIALIVLTLIVAAPFLAPYDPDKGMLLARLKPPGPAHFFGTDEAGRDVFSRVVYGARTSCATALGIVIVSAISGTLIGCVSGVIGGLVDSAIMRVTEVFLALPALVLALALAAALGNPSLFNALLAISVVRIPAYVRLARSQTLVLRNRTYVKASRSFGARPLHLLRWHIVPNALSPIIVQATLDIGSTILMAAALSFIGLGAQEPTAEWGAMVAKGRNFQIDQWWLITFPGLAILITAMGFNLLGDGLRDMLDPRLGGR